MGRYSCDRCSFKTPSTAKLNEHIWCVHRPNKYACPYFGCSDQYKLKSGLSLHLQNCHDLQHVFKCPLCNVKLRSSSDASQHVLLTHHNVEGFHCTRCPSVFSSQASVTRHFNAEHSNN